MKVLFYFIYVFIFKINLFILFIYFWLCWVLVAVSGLSLVVASGATLCCGAGASHCGGFFYCGALALGKPRWRFYRWHFSRLKVWTSLLAQWLRICLQMRGTRVWVLVREEPTCLRATKPVRHNYWAWALGPTCHNYWASVLQVLKPTRLEPLLHNKWIYRNEKPAHEEE